MRVKFFESVAGPSVSFAPGKEYDLEDGAEWVRIGLAAPVDDPPAAPAAPAKPAKAPKPKPAAKPIV